jgi:streptogramin lyase
LELAALATLLLVACGSSSAASSGDGHCSVNSDCPSNQYCSAGACVSPPSGDGGRDATSDVAPDSGTVGNDSGADVVQDAANGGGHDAPVSPGDGSAASRIYVADRGNNQIVQMDDMSGTNLVTLGTQGSGTNQFFAPAGIAVDADGHIYVADSSNCRIVEMDDITGSNWRTFGTKGSDDGQFYFPWSVSVDASHRIYVVDQGNARIVRLDDINGTNWVAYGSQGSGTGQFFYPVQLALDGAGHIFVADGSNQRVVRLDDMNGTGWTILSPQQGNVVGIGTDSTGGIYTVQNTQSGNFVLRFNGMSDTNPDQVSLKGTLFQMAVDSSGAAFVAATINASAGGIYRVSGMGGGSSTISTYKGQQLVSPQAVAVH